MPTRPDPQTDADPAAEPAADDDPNASVAGEEDPGAALDTQEAGLCLSEQSHGRAGRRIAA